MAGSDSSLKKKVAHGMKSAADKVDITCDRCGKLMKPGGLVKKTVGGEDFQFCSVSCASNFNAKIKKHEETPVWKKHAEDGPTDRSRTMMLAIITAMVAIIVLAGFLLSVALRPEPRILYSELSVAPQDVVALPSTPSGDNKTAIVPVRVTITNIGELESGVIRVICGAYNLTQTGQLVDEFNTSELKPMNGSVTVNKISPKGKSGCIVQATGNLKLPTGNYSVKLEIFEDFSKRTLITGSVIIRVDISMVAIGERYVPEQGSGRGKSASVGASGMMPGFEALSVLAAAASVAFLLRRSRK
jgi:hypothetical protein